MTHRSEHRAAGQKLATLWLSLITASASASIDMSGTYVRIQSSNPCQWTFVQSGTALQVTGACGSHPLSLAGTIDSATGAFAVTGTLTGLCSHFGITATADGEMFTGTYTCDAGSGPSVGTKCLNGVIDPGEECQDGNVNDGDCCSSRCRFEPAGGSCASDLNACTDDVCDGAGACTHPDNVAPCDDGDPCTVGDVCRGGSCMFGGQQSAHACAVLKACERTTSRALSSCIAAVGMRMRDCYSKAYAACPATDAGLAKAFARVASRIGEQCPNDAIVRSVGYGTQSTASGLIARVKEACAGEVASIVARTYGGPHAAVLRVADTETARALSRAFATAVTLLRREAALRTRCIATARRGMTCDIGSTNAKIAAAEASATASIANSSPALETTIGLDPAQYVVRAASQARCLTALAHANVRPFELDCGARDAVPVPPRGVWTHVVLDGATYGSRCGDGSPYAFWLRLAPDGSPSGRIVVNLQGGPACFSATDCSAQSPYFFSAMDEQFPPGAGILSTSAADNPFSDWTMVFLPICTGDLHLGGGVTETFPTITVNRFGAVNVRAALRHVRDMLWSDLDATDPDGYRPDRLHVLFAGMSSGGVGANANYHYLLDDLRWVHTTAVPDSALGIDNAVIRAVAPSLQSAWGTRSHQPSYCLDSSCALGTLLQVATAPRLEAVPEQRILNVSNQVDTEQATANFVTSTVDWVNAVRAAYCANRGLKGIRYWLPADPSPLHVFLDKVGLMPTVTADGQTLSTFLTGAFHDPGSVVDHVDEGTLVTDYPGVNPIPCP